MHFTSYAHEHISEQTTNLLLILLLPYYCCYCYYYYHQSYYYFCYTAATATATTTTTTTTTSCSSFITIHTTTRTPTAGIDKLYIMYILSLRVVFLLSFQTSGALRPHLVTTDPRLDNRLWGWVVCGGAVKPMSFASYNIKRSRLMTTWRLSQKCWRWQRRMHIYV